MSYALCYTSVPQGLRPGSRGYCTVGLTAATPAPLVETLESLSGYRPFFPAGSPRAADNPVSWAHWRVSAGGRSYSVLSRVCFAGLEFTKRSSVFAHHIALTGQEQPAGGPAWVMAVDGLMRTSWSEPPVEWPTGPAIPDGDEAAAPCAAWAAACGDAGWAGVLAQTNSHPAAKPAYVVFPPGLDLLPLVREALALLAPAARWQTTFNTYHTEAPAGSTCAWRFVVDGSPAAADARRGGGVLIDLTARLPEAPDGPLVRAARDGASTAAAPTTVAPASWTLETDSDDADADLMPIAPRGRVVASPGRATVAPAATAAPADPSAWMPPASATVVAPSRGPAAPVSPLAWAGAVAAGVVAASAAWYFPCANRAVRIRQLDESVSTLQTQADASSEAARVAGAKVETLRSQVNELQTKTAAAREEGRKDPDLTLWQPVLSASDPAAKRFTQIDLDRSNREAVEAAKKAMPVGPATTANPGPAESNGLTLRQPLAGLPADVAGTGNRFFDLDRLPNLESKKDLKVPLAVVADAGPELQVWLEGADDGDRNKCFYDRKTNTLQRDLKGTTGQETLAGFSIENGTVVLLWPSVRNNQDCRDVLRRSLLVISNGQSREAIQFVEPQTIAFTLHDAPAVKLRQSLPGGGRVVYSVAPDAAWKQTGTDAVGATQFAPTVGGPVVSFRMESDRLACDYADLWAKISADRDEKEKARNEQAAQLPKKDKGPAIDIERLTKDPLLKPLAERFKVTSDALEGVADQAKNMERFPPVTAVVRLNSGVVTHRIDIRPGNIPAKH